MLISFYDEKFKGLQDNASLIVDNSSYKLIKRGVDLDEMTCKCEAFTENIQPTFVVLKNDKGNYIYGALAGIPQLNKDNQSVITASDLKTMLKVEILYDFSRPIPVTVNAFFSSVFDTWNIQGNQKSFTCRLEFEKNVGAIDFEYLIPTLGNNASLNVWDDVFAPYLKYYGLFMTTKLDLVNKTVIFTIGKSMLMPKNIKLWEQGLTDFGKWVASVNETQGYIVNKLTNKVVAGYQWILTAEGDITTNTGLRNIYPIKRKIFLKETENENEAKIIAWLKESGALTSKAQRIKNLFNNFYAKSEFVQQDEISEFVKQLNTEILELEKEQKDENTKLIELLNIGVEYFTSLYPLLNEVNREALTELSNYMYKENVELSNVFLTNEEAKVPFEICFNFYFRGKSKSFKSLPCGELHYDWTGLIKIQAGYRFTGLQFLI